VIIAHQTSNCGTTRTLGGTKNCCKLKEAMWNQTSVLFGKNVTMNLTAINCSDNEKINFTIYNATNSKIASYNITIVANKSFLNWSANAAAGDYYFNVTLIFDNSIIKSSNLLTVSMPAGYCGDGSIDSGELCDKGIGGNTCASVVGEGYTGTLTCNSTCGFNTTLCIPPQPTQCAGYTTRPTCEGSESHDAANHVDEIGCPAEKRGTCYCIWNETKPVGERCSVSYDVPGEGGLCRCTRVPTSEGACNETTGIKIVNIQITITPISPTAKCPVQTEDCKSGLVEAPCGLVSADLPFFGWFNFAITLLAITIIYAYNNRRLN
jgi:hypothetical protein